MKKHSFTFIGFASTLLLGYLFLSGTLYAKDSVKTQDVETIQSRQEALTKFVRVLDIVEKNNVDPITINEIINKSLEGMLSNLDAHSAFLNAKHFESMKVQTNGEFGGLGITVGMRDGALTVISPIEGTPADKAGLKAEDIILKIEDKSTLGMTIDEAVNLMRGKKGAPINITIFRKGTNKPFVVKIIRDIIKIDSVYAKTIGDDILYLRVVSFDKKVVEEVRKDLKKYASKRKGIILDLRNNPGGLLSQAVGLVDMFVDKGTIVSQKGRDSSKNEIYSATSSNTYSDIPLVVLVNAGSASASEIVSGALQDLKRAVLVGKKTFGKGSVQMIVPVSQTEAIKLTIARYYLPSGRTIQAVGVKPDIEVNSGKVITPKENEFAIKEKDLKHSLEGELAKIDGKKQPLKESKKDKNIITKENINNDNQLKSAIDILRALTIVKR